MFRRENIAMVVAEFIGTFMLASVVLGMLARTSFPFFMAVSAGAVLGLMSLVIGNFSGAHLNPAVSIGMWWIRQIRAIKMAVFVATQLFAGFAAIAFNEYLVKKQVQSIAGDKFEVRVLVAEAVGTALFTFGVTAALSQGFKGLKKAFAFGGSLTMSIIVATLGSNGLLNPAVAIGVQSWSWAYVVGPILGALVGVSLYTLLFAPTTPKTTAKAKVTTKVATKKTTRKKAVTKKR